MKGGGGILKSGSAKNYTFQKFLGGNIDLEKSRFDWVFLNVGLPKVNTIIGISHHTHHHTTPAHKLFDQFQT